MTLRHTLTESVWQIAADTVIVSASGHAQDGLYHVLSEAWQGKSNAPSLHLIGDAYAPRNLRAAMVDGARVGREV